jgi:hypothetical protein
LAAQDANPEPLLPPSGTLAQRDVGGGRLARDRLQVETDELTVPLEDAPLNPRTTFAGWAWTDDEMRCP